MKKITVLLLASTCTLTFISNSFGMLTKTSRKITTQKKIRTFHASRPTRMDPLGTAAFIIAMWNAGDIWELKSKISKIEKNIIQKEEKNNLILKISEQNKERNNKIKTDE